MIRRGLRIQNKLGLHARAAAKLVHTASRFTSDIKILKDGEEVDGKSILGVLLLAAAQGCTLEVSADGRDEIQALDSISLLIDNKFDEGE